MSNEQFNARLPKHTHDQMTEIANEYGLTKTQIVILAIDRLHLQLLPNADWMQALTERDETIIKDSD